MLDVSRQNNLLAITTDTIKQVFGKPTFINPRYVLKARVKCAVEVQVKIPDGTKQVTILCDSEQDAHDLFKYIIDEVQDLDKNNNTWARD